MTWVPLPYHGDALLVDDPSVDLSQKKSQRNDMSRREKVRTRTTMLIKAYTYAKFLATVSSEALKSARARVPMRMPMFKYESQAENEYKMKASG